MELQTTMLFWYAKTDGLCGWAVRDKASGLLRPCHAVGTLNFSFHTGETDEGRYLKGTSEWKLGA